MVRNCETNGAFLCYFASEKSINPQVTTIAAVATRITARVRLDILPEVYAFTVTHKLHRDGHTA